MRIELSQPITAADEGKRTITGQIVTWDEVGHTSAGPAVFTRDSIVPLDEVTFRLEHERSKPLGRATLIKATESGMVGTFKIAATTAGTDALIEAAEGLRSGLSVGVEVVESTVREDGTLEVTAALMEEVSLVTHPAIASAQVTQVAASEPEPEEATPEPSSEEAEEPTEEEGATVDESTEAPVAEVTAAYVPRATVVDAFPYGTGQSSMFRDMLNASHDPEAANRAGKAKTMIEAAQKSSDVAQVIPPGYRPDLYVGQEAERTPFANAHTRMSISDATPFKIPVFTSETGLAGVHTEGTNPNDGSITFSELTVTPLAISGKFTASREMLDAANPNLDSIIIRAMAEDYAAHIEGLCATSVLLSTSGTNATGGKVTAAVTTNMGAFTAARRYAADHLIVGSGYWAKLAAEVDGSGRPLNPYLAPSNAAGSVSAAIAGVSVNGLTAVLSTDAAAKQAVLMRKADHLLFTSARLSWRWEEVAGPANIVFAQFGYAAEVLTNSKGAVVFTDGTT